MNQAAGHIWFFRRVARLVFLFVVLSVCYLLGVGIVQQATFWVLEKRTESGATRRTYDARSTLPFPVVVVSHDAKDGRPVAALVAYQHLQDYCARLPNYTFVVSEDEYPEVSRQIAAQVETRELMRPGRLEIKKIRSGQQTKVVSGSRLHRWMYVSWYHVSEPHIVRPEYFSWINQRVMFAISLPVLFIYTLLWLFAIVACRRRRAGLSKSGANTA